MSTAYKAYLPFVESRADDADLATLRNRLETDGYLFLKGLFAPEPLLELRRQVLSVCDSYGWLLDGVPLMEGRGRIDVHGGHWEITDTYRDVLKLEAFHALAHTPRVLRLIEALLGEEIIVHPRNIQRVTTPGFLHRTTPPHQDYHLIQGSHRFFTLWFPLGDCPRGLGGLAVARGSHKLGPLGIKPSEGTGGVTVDFDEGAFDWHASDFELGDAILLSGLTVHRALNNTTQDQYRLSCDFRYQPVAEPIVWDSLEPHMGRITWPEIYANWKSDEYKYYWRRYRLTVVPRVSPEQLIQAWAG